MPEKRFDLFCPQCNILVEARVIAEGNGGFRSDAISPLDEVDTEYHGEHYYLCLCGRCAGPFLIRQSIYGVPGEFETMTSESLVYPTEHKLALEGVPSAIGSAHDQAARAFSASLYEPCVLMCRKCLEATCKSLGATGRDLNAKLQNLFDSGQMDAKLLKWAHEVRLVGNEAAHNADAKVTKQDARDIFDFTEAILIYVFSLSARFKAFQDRRAKRKLKT